MQVGEVDIIQILKPDNTAYRIMTVDDSPFIIKQLARILTSVGIDIVATAEDGQEALNKYKELYPNVDLVTMDVTMPKMDGIAAVEEIRKFDRNAKIIMVTALGHEKIVRKAVVKGAKSFIVKPFQREKVLQVVKTVLEK